MNADGPHYEAICEACLLALDRRREEGGVEASWPSFEEYAEAVRRHPEPMLTGEELEGLTEPEYDLAYDLSFIP
jgi:hypothetical protein